MQIPQPEQRSREWYEMRNTMISASDWGTIVLPSNGMSGKNNILLKKCGEEMPNLTGTAIQWGVKYEQVANLIYEHRNGVEVHEFGCIRHPTIPFLGASPDGITADGVMLEIKCPYSREIDGIIPEGYYCQVQGQLEVCELDRCDFLEVKLMEYESEEDYLGDASQTDENRFYNRYGMEKGVVGNIYDCQEGKLVYEYSPVGILDEDLARWKGEVSAKYEGSPRFSLQEYTYWFLERVSCIPIYRNQEWFHRARPLLEEFWNQILRYRELGLEVLRQNIQEMKDVKKATTVAAKKEKTAPISRSRKITTYLEPSGEGGGGGEEVEVDSEEEERRMMASLQRTAGSLFTDEEPPKKNAPKKAVNLGSQITPKGVHLSSRLIAGGVVPATMRKTEKRATNFLDLFSDEDLREMRK
jgi:putative phage-type endonuclease